MKTNLDMSAGKQRQRWPRVAGHLMLVAILGLIFNHNFGACQVFDEETRAIEEIEAKRQEEILGRPERLTVVAPKYLRPQSDYHVLVSLANSQSPASVDVQLTGGRDSDQEQSEAKSVLINSGETQTLKFSLAGSSAWPAAEYFLNVSAQAVDRSWNFSQEAPLVYLAKSFSGLIQLDKAIYKPGQVVQFRALFLDGASLAPVALKNEINVTVSDPARNVIKFWSQQSTYRGLLTLELPLSEDPMLGDYLVSVQARQQEFSKTFTVAEYVLPTYDVQIQLPACCATYNESDVVATVRATYTYGKPVAGHVTLTVQPLVRFYNLDTRPLDQTQHRARLSPSGSADFKLNLAKELHLGDQRDLFEREIEFFALVEEDLTGRKYNRTSSMKIYDKKIKVEVLNSDERFKPGLRHSVRLKVAYQDDTPVENNGPQLEFRWGPSLDRLDSVKLRPVNGIVEHQFQVPAKIPLDQNSPSDSPMVVPSSLELQAVYKGHVHYLSSISAFHSQSDQYLQIDLPQLRGAGAQRGRTSLNVNDELKVQLRATEPMQQVTCQGLARGDIIWAWTSPKGANQTEFDLSVKLDQRMTPQASILCFYVRPQNKELIADSVRFQVSGLMRNFVKLTASREQAKPGQEVEVDVFTKPSSFVGLLALDQSVLLLKSGNDIDQKQVDNEIKSYGSGSNGDRGQQINTEMLFQSSDMVVLTNNLVYDGYGHRTGRLLYSNNLAFARKPVTAHTASNIHLDSLLYERQLSPPEFQLKSQVLDAEKPLVLRTFFPETWLWLNGTADASGQLSVKSKVPDTITSWQLSAFSMSEAHGLGLQQAPLSVRVFRPFFIKLNLPYSIIRGETVNIQAVVFNYNKRPTMARVTLDNSKQEFEFVEPANSIEDEKMTSPTSQSKLVRIPAEDGSSVSFLIRPRKLGQIDIKMVARGEEAQDGLVRKLLVKPEGQVQHFNKAMLLSLQQAGGQQNRFKRNVSIEVPANAVPDSRKVSVTLVGDLMGSGLSNVADLLRLPYGCGEQNMINLVPNIVLMSYLQSTGRLRDVYRTKALKNIETGYQRELNYRRRDGSFSAFGESDQNGSVWLTAYVLKSFQQTKQLAAGVTIDEGVLSGAANYLAEHSKLDGSIEEVGMLHHQALASGAWGRPTYLTAYVMIALLQRPIKSLGGGAETARLQEVVDKGVAYLERQLEELGKQNRKKRSTGDDERSLAYELAIITYALHMANKQDEPPVQWAYDRLWSLARGNEQDQLTWWPSSEKNPSSDEENKSARLVFPPPLKPLSVDQSTKQSAHLYTPDSLAVETSSLVLLTLIKRGELERALPIVRWLISQQNSMGGFSSTQDTVLAIEALAGFAGAHKSGPNGALKPLSIDVEVRYPRATSGSALNSIRANDVDQLLVSQSNALVQQTLRLPDNTSWVQLEAQGEGAAVVQVSWQYNLMVSAERPAFYLSPQIDKSSNANYLQLSICTYYEGAESASNMAVAEVELPSGYVADVEALPGLRRQKLIKRVDTAEGETKVLVYLEQVGRQEVCFTVPAHRSTKVANNKPVPVTIYDYYDRKKAARIFYEPPLVQSCDICDKDTCSSSCQPQKRRSERLLANLHEQRGQPIKHVESDSNWKKNDQLRQWPDSNSSAPSNWTRQDEALRLLPLAPVYLSLKSAIRSLQQS